MPELSLSSLSWEPADVPASIRLLLSYAEAEAKRQADWYREHWIRPSLISRALRLTAITCATAGGLAPIFKAALKTPDVIFPLVPSWFEVGQSGYVLIGIAAGCVAFDRFFGFSSSWIRYVTTAFAIEKALEEFRFEWAILVAGLDEPPSADQIRGLIEACRQFSKTVKGLVEEETKAWVTEFQNNLSQLEKDLKDRVAASKVEIQARAAEQKPGGVSVTVSNGNATDAGFTVSLDETPMAGNVTGNKAELMPVAPGMHILKVAGRLAAKDASASQIVTVAPGAVVDVTLTLV